jgi:hypothetical protein
MGIKELIVLQIIAHLITDYFLQSDEEASDKNEKGFKSSFMKKHFLVAFLSSWIFSLQLNFIWGALILSGLHISIDGIKKYDNSKNNVLKKYAFFIDQLAHLVVIIIVTFLHQYFFDLAPIMAIPQLWEITIIIAGYLFCMKPTNMIIREIIKLNEIKISSDKTDKTNESTDQLEKAGRMIGSLERILTLSFVLLGKYEAIGFLIAAKSIIRFSDKRATAQTEYVLIGTMLSLIFAVFTGLLTLYLIGLIEFLR